MTTGRAVGSAHHDRAAPRQRASEQALQPRRGPSGDASRKCSTPELKGAHESRQEAVRRRACVAAAGGVVASERRCDERRDERLEARVARGSGTRADPVTGQDLDEALAGRDELVLLARRAASRRPSRTTDFACAVRDWSCCLIAAIWAEVALITLCWCQSVLSGNHSDQHRRGRHDREREHPVVATRELRSYE